MVLINDASTESVLHDTKWLLDVSMILPRFRGAFEATFELEASDGRADDGVTGGEAADLHG